MTVHQHQQTTFRELQHRMRTPAKSTGAWLTRIEVVGATSDTCI